jgi:hypothetical protein
VFGHSGLCPGVTMCDEMVTPCLEALSQALGILSPGCCAVRMRCKAATLVLARASHEHSMVAWHADFCGCM